MSKASASLNGRHPWLFGTSTSATKTGAEADTLGRIDRSMTSPSGRTTGFRRRPSARQTYSFRNCCLALNVEDTRGQELEIGVECSARERSSATVVVMSVRYWRKGSMPGCMIWRPNRGAAHVGRRTILLSSEFPELARISMSLSRLEILANSRILRESERTMGTPGGSIPLGQPNRQAQDHHLLNFEIKVSEPANLTTFKSNDRSSRARAARTAVQQQCGIDIVVSRGPVPGVRSEALTIEIERI